MSKLTYEDKIEKYGYDILRTNKNKYHPPYKKEQIINRVLINDEVLLPLLLMND